MRVQASDTLRERSNGVPITPHRGTRRVFTAAVLLARKGRYAEATTLLARARDTHACSEAEALDLQARIYAQQGLALAAEACWRQAQTLESATHAYEAALHRLRHVRPSFDRWPRMVVALGMVVVVGMLVWQGAFVQPGVRSRQEASTAALRHELAVLQSAAQARDQEVTLRVAGVDRVLGELATRLEAPLKAMPTAAQMTADRNAILERIGAAVAQVSQAVIVLETNLSTRAQTVESDVRQRVETIQSGIHRAMQSLTTAEDIAHLGQALVPLQEQLAQVAAAVEELKPVRQATDDVAYLGQAMAHLQEQLAQVAAAAEEVKLVRQAADGVAHLGQAMAHLQEQLAQVAAAVEEVKLVRQAAPPTADRSRQR